MDEAGNDRCGRRITGRPSPPDTGLETMTTLSNATVLVVDDERPLADLYARWVGDVADARTAYDGEEALDQLDAAVDVLLLDRRMPGCSGDEVIDHMARHDIDVRTVMVTAVDPGFDIVDMAIDDYLVKPVDQRQLVETVEQMVVRDTYDDTLQQKFQLVEKKATLEAAKTRQELDDSEEYEQLQHELNAIERTLNSAVEQFDDTDFTVAFRDLPDVESADPSN
jgi:DNA-binding response OmpR family regulator